MRRKAAHCWGLCSLASPQPIACSPALGGHKAHSQHKIIALGCLCFVVTGSTNHKLDTGPGHVASSEEAAITPRQQWPASAVQVRTAMWVGGAGNRGTCGPHRVEVEVLVPILGSLCASLRPVALLTRAWPPGVLIPVETMAELTLRVGLFLH